VGEARSTAGAAAGARDAAVHAVDQAAVTALLLPALLFLLLLLVLVACIGCYSKLQQLPFWLCWQFGFMQPLQLPICVGNAKAQPIKISLRQAANQDHVPILGMTHAMAYVNMSHRGAMEARGAAAVWWGAAVRQPTQPGAAAVVVWAAAAVSGASGLRCCCGFVRAARHTSCRAVG
jgi:hypothetical protein